MIPNTPHRDPLPDNAIYVVSCADGVSKRTGTSIVVSEYPQTPVRAPLHGSRRAVILVNVVLDLLSLSVLASSVLRYWEAFPEPDQRSDSVIACCESHSGS